MIRVKIFHQLEGLPTVKFYNKDGEELPVNYDPIETGQHSITIEIPEIHYRKPRKKKE